MTRRPTPGERARVSERMRKEAERREAEQKKDDEK